MKFNFINNHNTNNNQNIMSIVTTPEKLSSGRPTWDLIFMEFCEILAKRSTCARLQTSAIIVKDQNVVAIGYNGCCSKSEHCIDFWYNEYQTKYNQQGTWEQFINSDYFYQAHHEYANYNELHGEMNAISNAARNNTSSEGSVMYSLFAPCINCAKLIVASRIRKVVFRHYYKRDTTGISFLTDHKVLTSQV